MKRVNDVKCLQPKRLYSDAGHKLLESEGQMY